MKPFYVVLLMGAAAIGGGLVVRYSDHPVPITMASQSDAPAVVAPPIPPSARVVPSRSVPVRSAPLEKAGKSVSAASPTPGKPAPKPEKLAAFKPEKPSAFSVPKHAVNPEPVPPESRIVARVHIPSEPPAVIPLERTTVASSVPMAMAAPSPVPTPPPAPAPAPAPPAPVMVANHATLKAGMLISARINEALSSNLNSAGDVFSGTLAKPLVADGFVIAERGARVRGEVVDSKSGGAAGEASGLTIRLREIVASDGQRVHIVSEPWHKPGTPSSPNTGNVYDAALTRGGAAVIRPATTITFRLAESVDLTEKH